MKFSTIIPFALAAAVNATTVSYDTGYDLASRSMDDVSCSDGPNGLITRYGWETQGAITDFPNIGGWQNITWNSPNCGTCLSLTYDGTTIFALAIDAASEGVNLGETAMNKLTNNQAVFLGRIDAVVTVTDTINCGLKPDKRSVEFKA